MDKIRILPALALALGAATARAGSVITTNLPSGTEIVNIDATDDGQNGGDGANNFTNPFVSAGSFTTLTLGPGTYAFGIVDATDAAARFGGLTSTQLGTIQGAWSYNTPWATDYLVFDSSAATDPTQTQLFTGAPTRQVAGVPGWNGGFQASGGYDTAAHAYQAAKVGGFANQIVVNPGGRYGGTVATTYTLTQTRTLIFDIPDYILSDNHGGVSVVVQAVQAVPEPTTFAALGMGALALVRRRRRA